SSAVKQCGAIFDALVTGDGAIASFQALPSAPARIADGDDPKSQYFLSNTSLEQLPFPARHLVDASTYQYSIDGTRALSMIAQLGCPFGCGFCGGRMSPFLRRVPIRSSRNNVLEMGELPHT